MTSSAIIQNIPCTLVTGFLGAGKTTIINQLLATKPADVRWALLINEFGRIGIDGALLKGRQNDVEKPNTIAIREVNGGCICCTSQLPLQIALTRLLSEHRPQRLIIEPTGLAHPHELVKQLSAPHWQTSLSMQSVITVLSGFQWQQEKYRSHEGFQAHVQAADVVIINRYEQLDATCQQDLLTWIGTLNAQASIIWAAPNDASSELTVAQLSMQLNQPSASISKQRTTQSNQSRISLTLPNHLLTNVPNTGNSAAVPMDDELPYRYHDEQQGMLLAGWRLPSHWMFAVNELQQWLLQLPNWQRIKGVVHTSDGWQQLNFTPDSLTITTTSAQIDSRIEVILLADTDNSHINSKVSKNERQPLIDWDVYDHELMALLAK